MTKIIWAGRCMVLSPTLLLGIEWTVHKYHSFLVWKSTWLEGLLRVLWCWRGPAHGHYGIATQAGGAAVLAGSDTQVCYVLNHLSFSFMLYATGQCRASASCYSHQRTQARKCLGLCLQESRNMACKIFRQKWHTSLVHIYWPKQVICPRLT